MEKGLYDCDCARLQAVEILTSNDESWLTDRLSRRFTEIIVDEFQDCSETELQIIDALSKIGINTVVVADPDQAIYEFRQASPSIYQEFRRSLRTGAIVELTTNYRSTPAICSIVNSLRIISNSPAHSVQSTDDTTIFVLVGSPDFQREQQITLLEAAGIPTHKSMILAHRKKDAAILAGTAVYTPKSEHKTLGVIRVIATLRTSKSTRVRKDEIKKLGAIIVELFAWNTEQKNLRISEKRDLVGLSDPILGAIASGLVHESGEWRDADQARNRIIVSFGNLFDELEVPLKNLKVSLKKLGIDHWKWWNDALSNASEFALPSSHIHGVKGLEFDAVLLALNASTRNPSKVLDSWESLQSTDALRVLYVGLSRAKRLLSIASPAKNADQLRRILDSRGVPTTWVVETTL